MGFTDTCLYPFGDETCFEVSLRYPHARHSIAKQIGLALERIERSWPGLRAIRLNAAAARNADIDIAILNLVRLPVRIGQPGTYEGKLDLDEAQGGPFLARHLYLPSVVRVIDPDFVVLERLSSQRGQASLMFSDAPNLQTEPPWIGLRAFQPEWIRWSFHFPDHDRIRITIRTDGRLTAQEVVARLWALLPEMFTSPMAGHAHE